MMTLIAASKMTISIFLKTALILLILVLYHAKIRKIKKRHLAFSVYKTMLRDNYSLTISILTKHKLQVIRKSKASLDRMTFIH